MENEDIFSRLMLLGAVVLPLALPGDAAAQNIPTNLTIGSGMTLTQANGGTVYHGGTGTLATSSSGGLISAVDTNFAVAGGTLAFHTVPTHNLIMNIGTGTAEPTAVPIGAGLNVTGGTLGANWANNNTVTALGSNLTISGGTLGVNAIAAASLFGNPAGTIGNLVAIALGANVTLSAGGTLSVSAPGLGTVTNVAGGNGVGGGPVTSTGTLFVHNQGTVACGGAITVTPTNGVDNVLVNGGATACTIDIGAPSYLGQPMRLQIKQGATAQLESFGTTVVFGSNPASFTATATAAATDFVQLIGANASRWAVVALGQGFSGL